MNADELEELIKKLLAKGVTVLVLVSGPAGQLMGVTPGDTASPPAIGAQPNQEQSETGPGSTGQDTAPTSPDAGAGTGTTPADPPAGTTPRTPSTGTAPGSPTTDAPSIGTGGTGTDPQDPPSGTGTPATGGTATPGAGGVPVVPPTGTWSEGPGGTGQRTPPGTGGTAPDAGADTGGADAGGADTGGGDPGTSGTEPRSAPGAGPREPEGDAGQRPGGGDTSEPETGGGGTGPDTGGTGGGAGSTDDASNGGTGSPATGTGEGAGVSGGQGTTAAQALGWGNPVRADDFTGGTEGWSIYDGPGHAGNGRRTPDAVSIQDGILTITGDSEGNTAGMAWNPGQKYGRWEGRVKAPASDPSYNALLLLWPDAENFPEGGEVDFMEMMDHTRQKTNLFLHYGADNSQVSGDVKIDGTQWHNWAVEWTPDHIAAFVDGKQWWKTTDTSILPPGPMHLCIQLDWFPKGGGAEESTMQVDWVKQYEIDGASSAGDAPSGDEPEAEAGGGNGG